MTDAAVPISETAPMSDAAFAAIANLARSEAGLVLTSAKATMVQSRLRKRLRRLGLKDFESYSQYVASPEGEAERRQMISALTTNVSHFFREAHHFSLLREQVFPGLVTRARSGDFEQTGSVARASPANAIA